MASQGMAPSRPGGVVRSCCSCGCSQKRPQPPSMETALCQSCRVKFAMYPDNEAQLPRSTNRRFRAQLTQEKTKGGVLNCVKSRHSPPTLITRRRSDCIHNRSCYVLLHACQCCRYIVFYMRPWSTWAFLTATASWARFARRVLSAAMDIMMLER